MTPDSVDAGVTYKCTHMHQGLLHNANGAMTDSWHYEQNIPTCAQDELVIRLCGAKANCAALQVLMVSASRACSANSLHCGVSDVHRRACFTAAPLAASATA